ncbi:hypothetical protein L1887_10905 [Cichorium endivia]|nr:hypothetical protein L1887_10905 [Cichorium endivia]
MLSLLNIYLYHTNNIHTRIRPCESGPTGNGPLFMLRDPVSYKEKNPRIEAEENPLDQTLSQKRALQAIIRVNSPIELTTSIPTSPIYQQINQKDGAS